MVSDLGVLEAVVTAVIAMDKHWVIMEGGKRHGRTARVELQKSRETIDRVPEAHHNSEEQHHGHDGDGFHKPTGWNNRRHL
jgi:hypothetical protein